ncbi:permease [Gemmatirosa kalamazoonensis]|uniref:Permease n=1 Tax=Gemmatirosa kalamazoonensis TaxID=861299 RepID=W0RJG8_9BACT|nr:ADOP family duplicated permease [Gemmatirosa kalamazoonensis]AHG89563.1 permease [Gemmatirosa kalamazoonensis]
MSQLWNDPRQALRALGRVPVFTLAVTLTLGLGIGLAAGTAVIARAVAFAGLPVRDAERVVVLWGSDAAGTLSHLPLSLTDLPRFAATVRGRAEVAGVDYNGAWPWPFRAVGSADAPLRLRGSIASGNLFRVLGARPVLGRALRPEDDVIGAPRVMVLSHAAWRTQFGGDPRVIGRTLHAVVWNADYTIVGVMPPGLDEPRGVQFWTAMAPTAAVNGSLEKSPFDVDVVARLAPGTSPEQLRDALTRFYHGKTGRAASLFGTARASVRTLPTLVAGDARPAFTALAAAAAIVLLVTCGNVAGLVLVRAARRRRELAVRAAIGAGRARLIGQLLAEHALLATAGGALGAIVAAGAVRAFVALAPAELPRIADVGVDWSVLVAAGAVTAVVVLLVGVAPAVAASRVAPADTLGGARGAVGRHADTRARRALIGTQVTLALVVLAGALLVGRSLANLAALDLGIPAADRLAIVQLLPSVGAGDFDGDDGNTRWLDALAAVAERLRGTPGVVAVAPVVAPPFSGTGGWDGQLVPEGAAPNDSARGVYLNMESTSADYLKVTGVPLLRGRFLTDADREGAPSVIVLSARGARLLWPNEDAVGKRVHMGAGGSLLTVVGVVGDTRYRDYFDPRPSLFFPYRQFAQPPNYLAVRTALDPSLALGAVRRAAREVSTAILVSETGTMRRLVAAPLARPRLLTAVLASYALVTVVLTVAGLYGVVAGAVAQRRRELGVRSALGATPRALGALVLGEGFRVVLVGAAVGLFGAVAGGRLLAATLHGVSPADPLSLGGAAVVLLGVCLAAAAVPAWRAARADPADVLRSE